jgi:hypothetical protein
MGPNEIKEISANHDERRAGSEVPRMNAFVAISADDRNIFDLLVAQPLVGQMMHMQVEQSIRAHTRRTTLTSVVTKLFSLRLQYKRVQ